MSTEDLLIDKLFEALDQQFSTHLRSVNDILKKRLKRNEKALWLFNLGVLKMLQTSYRWHYKSYKRVDRLYDQVITITSKMPELKDELKQLKEQKIEIQLEVSENIEKEIQEWFKEREKIKKQRAKAEKARSNYQG